MYEDEKKVNLIKCPLPKIIYMSIKGLSTVPKKPEKASNSTTYYTKKLTHLKPGLPSLKMSTKFSFSPNKTNYEKDIQSKKFNNLNTKKEENVNMNKINVEESNKINHNKNNITKQNMKEILNSYGLNRYYDKFIQNGINEQNFNQIGFMNKKMLNDFINILNIFPSHIVKMEQLHIHLKKMNNDNIQNQFNASNNNTTNNIHINNSAKVINNNSNFNNSQINANNNSSTNNNTHNNNNVNYVTLTFNRTNINNKKTRISHSQNKSKNRYINPIIKPKRVNSNRVNSEKNKTKKKSYIK